MFFLLFVLFTVLPLAEIYILVKSGDMIGLWNTISIVILSGFIGAWCVRAQAFGLVQKLNKTIQKGQIPGDELIAALCVFVGGVLMIAPGFITDILGLLLVLPVTRFFIVRIMKVYFTYMVKKGMAHVHVYKSENFNFTKTHFDETHYFNDATHLRDVSPSNDADSLSPSPPNIKNLN